MKLKNNALQKLYDKLTSGTFVFTPSGHDPIDVAFAECDDELSESITFEHLKNLQDRNDILKKSNDTLLSANMDLASKHRKLENEIEELHKHIDILSASERKAINEKKELETECETLKVDTTGLKERVKYLKKENKWLIDACITWAKKACERSKQINELKATLEKTNADRTELQKDRDSYHDLYTELSKEFDKKLNSRTDCLRTEVEWYRKHYKEQSDKIQELNHRLLSIPVNATAFEQGQKDLWDMLQNVNDAKPFKLVTCFPDVSCMDDILSWDLEDFLDAYKKWQKKKDQERTKHMRDYLDRFCRGRLCFGCPLESDEFKCGNGYSFKKFADDDWAIIPDEELKRYYEKVLTVNGTPVTKPDDPCSGVREKIKEACDAFYDGFKAALASEVKEVPVSCDIPIKDLASWECTIEATVEVNKDLLEKVCGVKPEEEAHKLEYGDAVRVSWRNYDYMYIGPEEKHIRLFNPKNHTVVCVSPTDKLTYQGCKIAICDEEDLRKIWNHKK